MMKRAVGMNVSRLVSSAMATDGKGLRASGVDVSRYVSLGFVGPSPLPGPARGLSAAPLLYA